MPHQHKYNTNLPNGYPWQTAALLPIFSQFFPLRTISQPAQSRGTADRAKIAFWYNGYCSLSLYRFKLKNSFIGINGKSLFQRKTKDNYRQYLFIFSFFLIDLRTSKCFRAPSQDKTVWSDDPLSTRVAASHKVDSVGIPKTSHSVHPVGEDKQLASMLKNYCVNRKQNQFIYWPKQLSWTVDVISGFSKWDLPFCFCWFIHIPFSLFFVSCEALRLLREKTFTDIAVIWTECSAIEVNEKCYFLSETQLWRATSSSFYTPTVSSALLSSCCTL